VLFAEYYAQHDHVRIAQLGWRHMMNESVNIDVLVGHQERLTNGSTFVTLGHNILLQ
jgi:hypothetical protein